MTAAEQLSQEVIRRLQSGETDVDAVITDVVQSYEPNAPASFDAGQFIEDIRSAAVEHVAAERRKRRIRWALAVGIIGAGVGYWYWKIR